MVYTSKSYRRLFRLLVGIHGTLLKATYVVSTGALTSCLSPHVNEASLITPRGITTGTGGRRLSIIRPRNVAQMDTTKHRR